MFVAADIEWVKIPAGLDVPTQLAASRVDETWNVISTFHSFIKPLSSVFDNRGHVALNGGSPSDFINAPDAYIVLADFLEWLDDDDIILWWHHESDSLFKKLVGNILKKTETHRSICINKHVHAVLTQLGLPIRDMYTIADRFGIDTQENLKHHSPNDVRVMCRLMARLAIDPLAEICQDSDSTHQYHEAPYQYDVQTGLVHVRGCAEISQGSTVGFESLQTPIRKGYKPCGCCKEDYRKAYRERNIDIINRSRYAYVYASGSNVYHRRSCHLILSAKNIMGAGKYETIRATRKRPCKICNPTFYDAYTVAPKLPKQNIIRRSLSRENVNAVNRQRIASKERSRRLSDKTLTEAQRSDIYTLTQPRFAFWASPGYSTFHLRSCPKLQGLSNLSGFARFSEAVRAGYSPCKKCKPTHKHDITLSIPISSRVREGELPTVLEPLCKSAGYAFAYEPDRICIETPAGKWRINTTIMPIRLEHINLVTSPAASDYHVQPRVFLSFIDVFDYIRRHDSNLTKKKGNK